MESLPKKISIGLQDLPISLSSEKVSSVFGLGNMAHSNLKTCLSRTHTHLNTPIILVKLY